MKTDVEEEKQIIRNELIKTEQVASDLKTQKTSLDTSLIDSERIKNKLEEEIQDLNRDKIALKETISALERAQGRSSFVILMPFLNFPGSFKLLMITFKVNLRTNLVTQRRN